MAEQFTLEIETGNAAFSDGPATEIARILRDLAARLERGDFNDEMHLRDYNGNRVGRARLIEF